MQKYPSNDRRSSRDSKNTVTAFTPRVLRRHCDFVKGLPLHLPSERNRERFLTVLTQKDVAASTQNQAFNAIIRLKSATEQPPCTSLASLAPNEQRRSRSIQNSIQQIV